MNTQQYYQIPVQMVQVEEPNLFYGVDYYTQTEMLQQQQNWTTENQWCKRLVMEDILRPEHIKVKVDKFNRCLVVKVKKTQQLDQQQQFYCQQYPQFVKRVLTIPRKVVVEQVKCFLTPTCQLVIKAPIFKNYYQQQQLEEQQIFQTLDDCFTTVQHPKVQRFVEQMRRCLRPMSIRPRIVRDQVTCQQSLTLDLETPYCLPQRYNIYCKPVERKLVIELPRFYQTYDKYCKVYRHEIYLPKWLNCTNMQQVRRQPNQIRLQFPCVWQPWQQLQQQQWQQQQWQNQQWQQQQWQNQQWQQQQWQKQQQKQWQWQQMQQQQLCNDWIEIPTASSSKSTSLSARL